MGRTKGGMNQAYAVTDANGRPISLFMMADQVSAYTGAVPLDSLSKAQCLLTDVGLRAGCGSPFPLRPRQPSYSPLQPSPPPTPSDDAP